MLSSTRQGLTMGTSSISLEKTIKSCKDREMLANCQDEYINNDNNDNKNQYR